MGKVSIIVVLIFIGIVTIISLTVFNSSSKVADLLATEETSDNLKNLGNYALNYAIKQVKNENVNQSTTQTFNDFQVLNGEINSIDYVFNAPKDSVKIFANVSWNGPYEVKQHQSQAWLKLTNIGGGSGSGNNVEPFELEEEKTNQYNVPPRSAFWKFNEDGGNTAYDSVSDNDGELIDGSYWNGYSLPQWVTGRTGKEGSALQFNGWDNYVHISDADSLDLTEEGTISAWIHINNYTNWAGFVHKGDSSDWYDEAYSLQTDYNGDKIVFIINNESGYDLWLYGNTALEKNTWYHLVATFNNEKLAIYIDGVLDEEINNTIGNVRNTNGGLNIGAQTNQYSYSYGNFSLDGIIDQVSIWKKFVNSSKAKKIYLQELASAYLPLNEESGDIAYDFSGADNHANLSGGLQNNWDEGIIEGGLHFISGSNRLQIHSAPNLTGMNKLSIFSWVKFDEFSNNLTDIVNKNSQYILRLQDSNDAYKPSGIIYADGNSHEVSSNYEINMLDRWYNIASIYDNKRMKIYVDNTDKSPNNNNINRDIDNTNNSIFIGSSSTSNQIKGSLDEVMIFNQEITDENLATLYKVDRIKELRGRWPLNEASGEIAYDTSKYSNNGELQNAWNAQTLPEWIEGKFHGALRFTGAGEFVGAEQNLVTQYPFS
ncbi:MAG: LamG domain-containing protein, partial [Candidatus Cloacimonadota bacterium]|nr:LamG domain-containing protein [Candidatus Cloacimonadota bacterium]